MSYSDVHPIPNLHPPWCAMHSMKKNLRFKRLIVIIITISGFEYFRKRQLQLSADQQGADPEVRRLGGQRRRDGGRGWRSAGWRDDPGKRDGVLRPLRLLRQVLSRRCGFHLLRLASVKSRKKSEAKIRGRNPRPKSEFRRVLTSYNKFGQVSARYKKVSTTSRTSFNKF